MGGGGGGVAIATAPFFRRSANSLSGWAPVPIVLCGREALLPVLACATRLFSTGCHSNLRQPRVPISRSIAIAERASDRSK